MSDLLESLAPVAIALLVTVTAYAIALHRRSWSLWLVAFGLTLVSLWVATCAQERARPVATILEEVTGA